MFYKYNFKKIWSECVFFFNIMPIDSFTEYKINIKCNQINFKESRLLNTSNLNSSIQSLWFLLFTFIKLYDESSAKQNYEFHSCQALKDISKWVFKLKRLETMYSNSHT